MFILVVIDRELYSFKRLELLPLLKDHLRYKESFALLFILILLLIICMKKFLDCDWLRGMQFLGNTVQKKGN